MKIRFNVVGYFDRRGPQELEACRAIEQERADQNIEKIWRERVRNNWKERARVLGVPRAWLSPTPAANALTVRQAE